MGKVCTLSEAVSNYVKSGDTICFGGFTTNRKPYAAVYEILRQGQKDFTVWAGPAGGDWDMAHLEKVPPDSVRRVLTFLLVYVITRFLSTCVHTKSEPKGKSLVSISTPLHNLLFEYQDRIAR